MSSIRNLPRTGPDIRALPVTGYNYAPNQPVIKQPTNSSAAQAQQQQSQSPVQSPQPAAPTRWVSPEGQVFSTQDDYARAIDDAYRGSFDYLNQAESQLKPQYDSALSEAQSIYNTNQSQLNNSKQNAYETLDTQRTKAQTTKDAAMAQSRQVFQEQSMGAQQRFGGTSSAGQAFSEIQARELARQQGSTQRQFTEIDHNLGVQRNVVDREYQSGLLQLEQNKQSQQIEAKKAFDAAILEIGRNRAQLGQAKGEARLSALQNYNNQLFSINSQMQQYQMQLALQKNQSLASLDTFMQNINPGINQVSNQTNAFNPQTTSPYSASSGLNKSTSQNPYVGSISSSNRFGDEDRFSPFA